MVLNLYLPRNFKNCNTTISKMNNVHTSCKVPKDNDKPLLLFIFVFYLCYQNLVNLFLIYIHTLLFFSVQPGTAFDDGPVAQWRRKVGHRNFHVCLKEIRTRMFTPSAQVATVIIERSFVIHKPFARRKKHISTTWEISSCFF